MITASEVSKTFRTKSKVVEALKRVSLTAEDGKITALLGPNGAGKTTFLRILAGLETPDCGEIILNHQKRLSSRGLAFLSEGCGLYPKLSGYENILYFAELYGLTKTETNRYIEDMSEHLGLKTLLDKTVSGFSQGERMRLLIARAIIHQPQTIVLDEPTNGLDIVSVRKLRAFLKFLTTPSGGSRCILFSTHVMNEVEKLADKVVVISNGEIKVEGSLANILEITAEQDFEEAFVKLAYGGAL